MKITIEQLRRVIREEIESVSEGFNDDYLEKVKKKQVVMIPPAQKPQRRDEVPVGKQRLPDGYNFDDLLASMTPEQKEELLAALKSSK
jgi:hypothetical protein